MKQGLTHNFHNQRSLVVGLCYFIIFLFVFTGPIHPLVEDETLLMYALMKWEFLLFS